MTFLEAVLTDGGLQEVRKHGSFVLTFCCQIDHVLAIKTISGHAKGVFLTKTYQPYLLHLKVRPSEAEPLARQLV